MGIIEGSTNVAISKKEPEEKNELMKILFVAILVRLLFIYFVAV